VVRASALASSFRANCGSSALIAEHHDRIAGWAKEDVPERKICELLERSRVFVPERTVNRYVTAKFPTSAKSTVRVVDGEPGHELQVDFGELGMMFDEGVRPVTPTGMDNCRAL
jgi:hypothetical protein